MQLVGLAIAVVSAIFNGSFVAFAKGKSAGLVHPFVFNLYLSLGVFGSSLAVIPFALSAPLSPSLACPFGLLAGFLFVGASSLSFLATSHVGLSTGQGVWGGSAILVAFLWGTLGPSPIGVPVVNLPLSVLAILLLLLGVVGIVKCEPLGDALLDHLNGGVGMHPRTEALIAAVPHGDPDDAELTSRNPAPDATDDAPTGSRAVGLTAALFVGLFGGSILVPLGFLGPSYKGSGALAFLPSFGLGSLVGSFALCVAWRAWSLRASAGADAPPLVLGNRYTLLAGLASGVVWNLGNLCQIIAMSIYHVKYGVSYPILQASLVVAGLLGILVFGELTRRLPILVFAASSLLVVSGALLLGLYGPSPSADPSIPPLVPPSAPPFPPPPPHSAPWGPPPLQPVACLITLGKELSKIMIIQLLGYVLKQSGAITPVTEAGIGHYVGMIGFPCVLFVALATVDMSATGQLHTLVAIGAAKAVIFALSYALGYLTSKRSAARGDPIKRGALFAIYGTQSDDVALGVPVVQALFGEEATAALFVLSAMQSLVFNPTAYVLLGYADAQAAAANGGGSKSLGATACHVLLGLRKNVLVLSVVVGLIYRAASRGAALPWFIDFPVQMLGRPFMPLVYLIGGFGFVDAFGPLRSLRDVSVPLIVVALKSICLPIAALGTLAAVETDPTPTMRSFLFLYALLPCANSALVIARMYGADGALNATLRGTLALNKLIAFPLLFFAGGLLTAASEHELMVIKLTFSCVMLWASIAGGTMLILCALLIGAWRRCRGMRSMILQFTCQLLFAIVFIYAKYANTTGRTPPTDHKFVVLYTLVSVFRWAVDGSLLLISLDWARCACLSAWPSAGTFQPVRAMPLALHLIGAAAISLGLTLPFTLGGMPWVQKVDIGIDFWLAYGPSQALVYSATYGVMTLCALVSILVVGVAKRSSSDGRSRLGSTAASNRTSARGTPALLPTPGLLPSAEPVFLGRDPVFILDALTPAELNADPYPYPLRLGVLLVCATIRWAGSSGLCASLANEAFAMHTFAPSTTLEMMMVLVALEDGQGMLSCLLFALHPTSFTAVVNFLQPKDGHARAQATRTRSTNTISGPPAAHQPPVTLVLPDVATANQVLRTYVNVEQLHDVPLDEE